DRPRAPGDATEALLALVVEAADSLAEHPRGRCPPLSLRSSRARGRSARRPRRTIRSGVSGELVLTTVEARPEDRTPWYGARSFDPCNAYPDSWQIRAHREAQAGWHRRCLQGALHCHWGDLRLEDAAHSPRREPGVR